MSKKTGLAGIATNYHDVADNEKKKKEQRKVISFSNGRGLATCILAVKHWLAKVLLLLASVL